MKFTCLLQLKKGNMEDRIEKIKFKTWDEIKSFDEIILEGERKTISKIEKELKVRCPYLRKEGEFFYYCGLNLPEVKDKKPEPFNPIVERHVDYLELQLHCMDNFETCCYFSGKIKI